MSVAKTVSTPIFKETSLSSPAPVSMDWFGSKESFPLESLLYCMKTRFQNSKNFSPERSSFGFRAEPYLAPRSKSSSEQGPQGPVSPMLQKLSFSPIRMIRDSGTHFFHSSKASSSCSKTVTHTLSSGKAKTSMEI